MKSFRPAYAGWGAFIMQTMKGFKMFITSKMASAVDYVFYKQGANKINFEDEVIHVNGGADVINKRTLETPSGAVTELTSEQYDKLKNHPLFKTHVENGFISVCGNEKEAQKADKDLNKDKSSQITPDDYEKGNSKKEIQPKKKPSTKK